MDKVERRLIVVWVVLMALTVFSWEAVAGSGWSLGTTAGALLIIGLALVKVRIVVLDLMEVRRAPLALRLVLETWIILVGAAMIAMYLSQSGDAGLTSLP